jgi:PAS domain S-box-containing protein
MSDHAQDHSDSPSQTAIPAVRRSLAKLRDDELPHDIHRELHRRQIAEVYRGIPASAALSFVGALLAFGLLFMTGDAERGLFWMVFATGVLIYRIVIHWEYAGSANRSENPALWTRFVITANILAGIQWGLLGTWLYSAEPTYRALLSVMAIIGYVGGSVVLFSAVRHAHTALSVTAAIPASIYIFFIHPSGNPLVGAMALLLFGSIIYMAEQQYRIIRARILSEIENEMHRAHAEQVNNSLGHDLQALEHRAQVVKRSQLEAKRRATILAQHMESTLLPVIECTANGRIIEWNLAAQMAFGYSASEATQLGLPAMVTAADPAYQWQKFFDSALNAKAAGALEAFIRSRDGKTHEVVLYVTPIDIDGRADRQAMRAAIIVTNMPSEISRYRQARTG